MILSAHQPQFLPWPGYFDKMLRCDVFVLLDDVQFKKNEWQNRNRVWSAGGGQWLTVPVLHRFGAEIREVPVNNAVSWREKQLKTLRQTYSKAPCFSGYFEPWERMYGREWGRLLDINLYTVERLRAALRIDTRMELSSSLGVEGKATERLVNLCRKFGADTYLAGAGGREYMELPLFERAGVRVVFQEFRRPEYPQFGAAFVPNLTALDMVLHLGIEAADALRAVPR